MTSNPTNHSALRFGTYEFDPQSGELRKQGMLIRLKGQPIAILTILLNKPGEIVTREELQKQLWPADTFVDFEHSLNAAVTRLRVALNDSAEAPRYIKTMSRQGYRFIAPVEIPSVSAHSGLPVARRNLPWKILALGAVVVAMTATGLLFHFRSPVLAGKHSVVVTDFNNSTGDAVFDGTLRQGLSVQLEQSPFLNIVSEQQIQQTLQMMGRKPDATLTLAIAREICQRTSSAAVLDGSIAQIGTQYILTLKAVNCLSGESLASTEAQASDKNHVLDALGKAASEMRRKVGESHATLAKFDTPLEQATTPSLEALKAFSSGSKLLDGEDYNASVLSFQRAIALDPDFALAYLALAASYANLGESSLASANAKKAYELREKVSGLEKFLIEAQYNWIALGDLEKSRDVLEMYVRTYPRDSRAHFGLGNVYDSLGQYEKGLGEARECVRLEPASELSRDYLVYSYFSLNRFGEAQNASKEALARKIPLANSTLYGLAFWQNDATGMAQQVASAMGKPGIEDVLLGLEANTVAYAGQLAKARELSRRAVAAAEQAKVKETSAGHEASAALREALFGNGLEARQSARGVLRRSGGRDVQYAAALALALAGDSAKVQSLADDLSKLRPEDTIVRLNYLPTLRAQLALNHQDPAKAIDALQIAIPYDLMTPANPVLAVDLYPVFVRGEAYLAAHQGSEAAAEFQKILNHPGIVLNSPIGALAHLGLARGYFSQGDTVKAKAAYQDFLTLWKGADPDIPILKEAKAEYAKLQ